MARIRELRESKGMQQKELAIDLCVSQPTISDWESGRKVPSARSTQKLADYFHVSIDYLLGEEEESERENSFLPERLQEALGNMSCEEFAQKFHYKPKIVSNYLEGKRKPLNATLFQMASDLGVNPEWLYGHDAPKYKKPAPDGWDGLNEREQLFMNLVDGLTPDQQLLLLAQLQAWNEQNQRQALAAQQSDSEKAP